MNCVICDKEYLELRGAHDLLCSANRKVLQERYVTPALNKDINATSYILTTAAFAVHKQLRAVLGQSKEYNQAAALLNVK